MLSAVSVLFRLLHWFAMENVLAFPDARALVEDHAANLHPPRTEHLDILRAIDRVLAEPLLCDRDLPPFNRSTRDGYALRSSDLTDIPRRLKVVGELRAGSTWPHALERGHAVEIMTGAGLPEGADSVVMVEYTQREADHVVLRLAVTAGENVVPIGSEARADQTLVRAGTRIDHAVVALAASVGVANLNVYTRPSVAVLATGDELVPVTSIPGPAQIRNSNSYSLAAQVVQTGGQPIILDVARDERESLERLIREGMNADLLLLSGGVSMGKYDLVEQVLRALGAEFFFTGVKIQPGKPLVFGRLPKTNGFLYFFGLPGNPVSTMVTFALFVDPLLRALSGETGQPLRFLSARLKSSVKTKTGLTRFLPARLISSLADTQVELARWQGSGDIAAVSLADCFIVVPPDREDIPAGEFVSVLLK
jgi:molybdopterin molybdotransferase